MAVPEPQRNLKGPGLSVGAGEGNRTLVISLEGCCSTIELHPRRPQTNSPPSLRYGATAFAPLRWLAEPKRPSGREGWWGR
jgi:hypothetical protein